MKRKEFLQKKLNRLNAKKQTLLDRSKASTDAAEVRAINEQMEEINDEIDEVNEELAAIDEDQRAAEQTDLEQRDQVPANAKKINADVVGSFGQITSVKEKREEEDPLSSMEYRMAFKEYIQRGTPIPKMETRNGEAISTNETGALIPMTIMNEVINTVRKRYGNLYSKVRKMSVPGGVKIAIGALEASFKWINESTVSPREKVDKLGSIVFEGETGPCLLRQ